ncbi:MAG TPA: hypothetical protein VNT55_04815 [Baekduia sp.]|nr:hypothetical protein [Baekduia sp.]
MLSDPVGCHGRVTASGAITPDRTGEVMVAIGGGVQAFMARDADGGAIDPYEEIVVVDRVAPRTVLVTRLYDPPIEGEDPVS